MNRPEISGTSPFFIMKESALSISLGRGRPGFGNTVEDRPPPSLLVCAEERNPAGHPLGVRHLRAAVKEDGVQCLLSCGNSLWKMKNLILDENPAAIFYLQRSDDRQVQLRDPEEFPTGDRAREESGAMIHLTHRSDNVEARATG